MRKYFIFIFLLSSCSTPKPIDYGRLIVKSESNQKLTCEQWMEKIQLNLIECKIRVEKLEHDLYFDNRRCYHY